MKKLFFTLSIISVLALFGMQQPQPMETGPDELTVKLITNDDVEIEWPISLANESNLIKNILADLDDTEGGIPLSNITERQLLELEPLVQLLFQGTKQNNQGSLAILKKELIKIATGKGEGNQHLQIFNSVLSAATFLDIPFIKDELLRYYKKRIQRPTLAVIVNPNLVETFEINEIQRQFIRETLQLLNFIRLPGSISEYLFSPNSEYLIYESRKSHYTLNNLITNQINDLSINDLSLGIPNQFSPNSEFILFVDWKNYILYTIKKNKQISLKRGPEFFKPFEFSPNTKYCMYSSPKGHVLYNIQHKRQLLIRGTFQAFSPDSQFMLFKQPSNLILQSLETNKKISLGNYAGSFNANSRFILCISANQNRLYDIHNRTLIDLPVGSQYKWASKNNSDYLLYVKPGGQTVLYNIVTKQEEVLPLGANYMQISNDFNYFFYRRDGFSYIIYNRPTSSSQDIDASTPISISPDGYYIVYTLGLNSFLYTVQTGRKIKLEGKRFNFSPNSKYILINAGHRSMALLYSLETNSYLTLPQCNAAVFSPNSQYIALDIRTKDKIITLVYNLNTQTMQPITFRQALFIKRALDSGLSICNIHQEELISIFLSLPRLYQQKIASRITPCKKCPSGVSDLECILLRIEDRPSISGEQLKKIAPKAFKFGQELEEIRKRRDRERLEQLRKLAPAKRPRSAPAPKTSPASHMETSSDN